jgi:hypothetical protein
VGTEATGKWAEKGLKLPQSRNFEEDNAGSIFVSYLTLPVFHPNHNDR